MTVWVGLGSNLENPARHVCRGLGALDALPDTRLAATSSLYGSRPVGPRDQPDFINAVAALETTLPPLALLDALQELEHRAGRVRTRHWGERTLDLDILLWDERVIEHERLRVPHPGLTERPFVLIPLAELAPGLVLPDGRCPAGLARQCDRDGVWYQGPAVLPEGRTGN